MPSESTGRCRRRARAARRERPVSAPEIANAARRYAGGVEADERAAFFVFTNRGQHFAELRARERAHADQHARSSTSAANTYHSLMSLRFPNGPSGERRQRRAEIDRVHGPIGSSAVGNDLQAVVAVGPILRLFDDEEDHLRERERQAARSRCRTAARPARRRAARARLPPASRRARRATGSGCCGIDADQQQRRDVAAAAVEHRVAVREQSGVAEQQVEADRGDAHDQDLRREARVAVDRVKGEREEHEADRGEEREAACPSCVGGAVIAGSLRSRRAALAAAAAARAPCRRR